MEKKRQIFEETLTKSFDNDNYLLFLRELFDNIELVAPNREMKPYNTFSAAVENYRHIANYTGEDNNKVALFSVCLKNDKNLENARSMQRSFVKNLLENSNCAGALVAFYTNGEQDKWRLSLVRMDYEFSKGKISEKLTPAKRYSYLVGKGEPCHTAKERLYPLFCSDEAKPGLDALEDAFSVEAVTKDFFDKYREKYLDLKEFLDGNEQFKAESEARGFDSEQFAKKLMGQIVFLYFIQKKGWLGVNAFPAKLTEREFKDGFYRPGRKPKELLPQVYKPQQDGFYYRDTAALLALSAEDEEVLSTLVKGDAWGSGPKDFMRHIFEGCKAAGKNFFDDYLEPLFYTGLNKNRGENAFFQPLHRRVPFLNGGLFEELDGYDWENNDFSIANELFSNADIKGKREADGILDVFDRYNFTMAEDEPMEREVAIDPEMLGKVFENLLDVTDRKSKGAFYTPREIVHYMCQETIINYLSGKTAISDEDIRKFILYGEYFRDEDTKKTLAIDNATGRVLHDDEIYAHKHHMEFDKEKDLEIPASIFCFKENVNRLKEIDDLLANVKVVDPAVGSGAFPLGMLTEIVKARDTITSYMGIGLNGFQRMSLRSMRNIYRLKRETIKNCIFACDIEPSATDITKLRLWLSLVIDNQIMNEDNDELGYTTKPRELPNLDCNIICGNSLIDEFEGVKLITENSELNNLPEQSQGSFYDLSLGKMINDLIELQDKLYDEKDHTEKESLKRQIQDIYDKIIMKQLQGNPELVDEYYKAMQLTSKPFVLWQIYFPKVFRDNGGFDVVIGNPPYVSTKGQTEEEKNVLERIYGYADDLYYHFIDKGFYLLAQYGVIAMITPDTFFTTLTKLGLRQLLLRHRIIELVQLGHDVFESAMVATAITVVSKESIIGGNMIHCVDVKNKPSIAKAEKIDVEQEVYNSAINNVFYMPTKFNIAIKNALEEIEQRLLHRYFPMIATSRDIAKNQDELEKYRESLSEGDWTLIGLVTEGGVGLQTGNNGKYIGYKFGTKEAKRAYVTRLQKLNKFNREYNCNYKMPKDELAVWDLFESIKEKYDRDIFGQGYLYKVIPEKLVADLSTLTNEECVNGIAGGATFVPYDKGDKEGNRWYNETPYLLNWSKDNVAMLKALAGKKERGSSRFQNSQFYFRRGFCYSDIKTFFLKARMKGVSVHDVKSMSLFPTCEKIPYYYIVTVLNTEIIATIVYNFLNNTPSFQMNDCRMLPILVPSKRQLDCCRELFDQAVDVQKKYFDGSVTNRERDERLVAIQRKIDMWACDLYGISSDLLVGERNIVR